MRNRFLLLSETVIRGENHAMSNLVKALVFLLIFSWSFAAEAQYIDRNQTTFYVGMALPRTNLSDFAEQGINVGIREDIPIRKHFSLMVSAELFRNRLAPEVHVADHLQGFTYTNMAKIYNIPVFAHLNFGLRMDRHSNFRLWTEGAMGVNFRIVTLENGTLDQTFATDAGTVHYRGSFVTAYDYPKVSLATQWGIGFTLFRRYSLGYVRYNLGRKSLTGNRMLSDPHFLYDDGSDAPSDGLETVDSFVKFNLGKLRSRYHVIRFGITF